MSCAACAGGLLQAGAPYPLGLAPLLGSEAEQAQQLAAATRMAGMCLRRTAVKAWHMLMGAPARIKAVSRFLMSAGCALPLYCTHAWVPLWHQCRVDL